jgi:hypothetical protein
MNTKHCNQNFNNYSVQISVYLYINFFRLTALTILEPSTLLTLHQPVPLSLYRWTLAWYFTAALQALSLVSTRIGRWWTPVSLSILSLAWRGMAPSPSAGCQLYCRENDSITIHCGVAPLSSAHCLTVERLHCHHLSRCEKTPSVSTHSLSPWD